MKFYTNNFVEYNLQGDIKLLLVTVNNRLKSEIEIVHDLSCHPIFSSMISCFHQQSSLTSNVTASTTSPSHIIIIKLLLETSIIIMR